MSEDVLAGLEVAAWAPAAASFIFGVGIGWLVFGGRRPEDLVPRAVPPIDSSQSVSADPAALDALQSQIRTARDLMAESDGEIEDVSEQLDTLDSSLKMANARLKAVLQALRRVRGR